MIKKAVSGFYNYLLFNTMSLLRFREVAAYRLFREKDIWLDSVNGHKEHAHCLVSLGREQTISKVAQLIKGESSFWINKNEMIPQKFEWQDDFWAVSVSESHVPKVQKYIAAQEQHHGIKSFKEEIDEFMEKYGWSYVSGK